MQTISKILGEDNLKRIVNWVMKYLAEVDIPVKVRERVCVLIVSDVYHVHVFTFAHECYLREVHSLNFARGC